MSNFSASLDPYIHSDSPLHRLDARVKLSFILALILLTSLLPVGAWLSYLLIWLILLALSLFSKLGIALVLKRALVAIPFVLAAVPLLFTGPDPKVTLFSVNHWDFIISQTGLVRLISIGLKSWLSVQAAIILSATTPFSKIAVALRALRLPKLFVSILSLMWRYLFMMVDQTVRLIRARASRSGTTQDRTGLKPGGSLRWRARVTGGMAGNLFLRSLERSDRVYAAMLSRGYDGEQRSLSSPPLSQSDWLVLAISLLFLVLIILIAIITGV
jgi:cobalt/nickel transport system permease protein